MKAGRGFSLVELMIAVTLGILVVGSALAAVATTSARHRETDELTRLQEHAAHAFAVLEPSVQMAAFGGLRPLAVLPWPASLPAGATACGTAGRTRPLPLRVDAGPWALGCAAGGGGHVPGTEVLTVARASGRLSTPRAGRLQLLSARDGRRPQGVIHDGRFPAGVVPREGLVELRDLVLESFYVARRADGEPLRSAWPALRVKELTEIAGAAAFRDIEIVGGVEDLRFEEGWRDAAGAPLQFGAAGTRPPSRPVEALRVHLRLRSREAIVPARPVSFEYAGHRFAAHDGFLRLHRQRTMQLRNVFAADGGGGAT